MFDINGGEMLVLLVVAVVVIGPERLPRYAEQLAGLVKRLRAFLASTRERVDSELGGDEGVDWSKLDPRQYDPRRIVRDALLDDDLRSTFSEVTAPLTAAGIATGLTSGTTPRAAGPAGPAVPQAALRGAGNGAAGSAEPALVPAYADPARMRRVPGPAPFDDEAT